MMRLVWKALLIFCAVGANLQVNASDACLGRLDELTANIEAQNKTLAALFSLAEKLEASSKCVPFKVKLGDLPLKNLTTGFYYYNYNHIEKKNWREARNYCADHGMKLVSFETEEELKIVFAGVPEEVDYWVDASDIGRQSEIFHWTDGREVNSTWFRNTYPSRWGSDRPNGVTLRYGAKLEDSAEKELHGFICEVAPENAGCV